MTLECPICYEPLNKGTVQTNCSHTFCFDCFILYIVNINFNNTCPICRRFLIEKNDFVRSGAPSPESIDELDSGGRQVSPLP